MSTEELRRPGDHAGLTGSFHCVGCGFVVTLTRDDALSACPECGGEEFGRASMFGSPSSDGQDTVEHPAVASDQPSPDWLSEVREAEEGPCLIADMRGRPTVHRLTDSWTRIGRSVAAGIRLDDPTVSRRHAIVVCDPDNGVHVLDDRSVNGIYLNGSLVEWEQLRDGDELRVGRFRLWFYAGDEPSDTSARRDSSTLAA